MTPWWHFDLFEVAWCVIWLTVIYAILGPPDLLGWLLLAPMILLGKLIGHLVWGRRR